MNNTEIRSPGVSFWWPRLDTAEASETAIENSFAAAILAFFFTAMLTIVGAFGLPFLDYGVETYPDALLAGFLAWGLKCKSRAAAVTLLVYFLSTRAILFFEPNPFTLAALSVISCLWALFYWNGVRAAFAWHRHQQTKLNWKNVRACTGFGILYGLGAGLLIETVFVTAGVTNDDLLGLLLMLALFSGLALCLNGRLPGTKNRLLTVSAG